MQSLQGLENTKQSIAKMFAYVDQLENELFVCRTPRPKGKNADDEE